MYTTSAKGNGILEHGRMRDTHVLIPCIRGLYYPKSALFLRCNLCLRLKIISIDEVSNIRAYVQSPLSQMLLSPCRWFSSKVQISSSFSCEPPFRNSHALTRSHYGNFADRVTTSSYVGRVHASCHSGACKHFIPRKVFSEYSVFHDFRSI